MIRLKVGAKVVPRDVDGIVHFCVELIFKDDEFL